MLVSTPPRSSLLACSWSSRRVAGSARSPQAAAASGKDDASAADDASTTSRSTPTTAAAAPPLDDPDWRTKAKPVAPGSSYPAKEHCSQCGLCDTYFVAHVKEACAFLGEGKRGLFLLLVFLGPFFFFLIQRDRPLTPALIFFFFSLFPPSLSLRNDNQQECPRRTH